MVESSNIKLGLKRANTMEEGALTKERIATATNFERVETREEKEIRISLAWEKVLDSRQLSATVRNQMSNVSHINFHFKPQVSSRADSHYCCSGGISNKRTDVEF
jgi:hypothetical protein